MNQKATNQSYDLIVVGTGFASTFFLLRFLERNPKARVLVLERGEVRDHSWHRRNYHKLIAQSKSSYINKTKGNKSWFSALTFGGGSNCWWACTPRFMPNDFRMHSEYGVGTDWPLSYQDLEQYYSEAEELMQIAGEASEILPRSTPFPQPPHNLTEPDKLLKKAYPSEFIVQPTARARVATKNRARCCASGVCTNCPVDAKFTILNEMITLYQNPNVTLLTGSTALSLELQNKIAKGVLFIKDEKEYLAKGNLIALGANAIFNPHILLQSGIKHPKLGKGLNEQRSISYLFDLAGIDNFQGSTSITGHGYMLYDGKHRADHSACLIESYNIPELRPEENRWQQRLRMKFIFEELPQPENTVQIVESNKIKPKLTFTKYSDYSQRAIENLDSVLPKLLSPLPIERIVSTEEHSTENHIMGTTPMGNLKQESIVDSNLVHHDFRNLVVVGSSVFPTTPPANPTLTICALALLAADRL